MLAVTIPATTSGAHAMSESGDVVWSDGKSWQRGIYGSARGVKAWWVNPAVGTATLEELRHADDFRWLVRDGKRVVHADDCPPQVAYEAYAFQASNLWELLAQAEKERDTAEQQLATAQKSLTDWARAREERDQARRELADLQRLVAAAEANEPVLVHPDWRQAEIDALAEERDQLKEKVRMLTLVSRHETLVAEAYRLENIIKETSKERDELNEKLATEKSIREQLQRNLDYAERQYIELRRQFDVVVNDRNTLRARCDELERGDRYSCGFKCGRQEERRAVVAWLNKNPQGWARQWSLAGRIERGEHDV